MNRPQQPRFRLSANLRLVPLEGRLLPTNLIPNGNFELGNVGFASQHAHSPGDIFDPATYDIVTNPQLSHPAAGSYGDHTTGSGLMMAVNGAVVADQIVWTRIVNVAPNAPYIFSAWVSNWDVNPNHPVAKLEFRLNNVLAGTFNAPSVAGVWARFSAGWHSSAANKVKITITNQDLTYAGNDFALDDISLVRNKPGLTIPGGRDAVVAIGALQPGDQSGGNLIENTAPNKMAFKARPIDVADQDVLLQEHIRKRVHTDNATPWPTLFPQPNEAFLFEVRFC